MVCIAVGPITTTVITAAHPSTKVKKNPILVDGYRRKIKLNRCSDIMKDLFGKGVKRGMFGNYVDTYHSAVPTFPACFIPPEMKLSD